MDKNATCEKQYVGGANNVWTYNDQRIFNSSFVLSLSLVWVGFGLWDHWIINWGQSARFDNIKVALYTYPEPNVVIGNEEQT